MAVSWLYGLGLRIRGLGFSGRSLFTHNRVAFLRTIAEFLLTHKQEGKLNARLLVYRSVVFGLRLRP